MKEMEERVKEEFTKGYDCSQIVLREFAEELGITEDEANRIAACFGGGMMEGEVCGAVAGALLVIGLQYGHSNPESLMEEKAVMVEKSAEFRKKFKEKYGTLICRALLGYDVSRPEELQAALDSGKMMDFCPKAVCAAVRMLREVL